MNQDNLHAIGIDLGTTNSAAAEITWDQASDGPLELHVLEIERPTREGVFSSPLVPSVVAILPNNEVWVGEGAKRLRAFPVEYGLSFEKNLFYDTKNEVGLRKAYQRALKDFDHASKIGGKILQSITEEAEKQGSRKPRRGDDAAAYPMTYGSSEEENYLTEATT